MVFGAASGPHNAIDIQANNFCNLQMLAKERISKVIWKRLCAHSEIVGTLETLVLFNECFTDRL